MRETASPNDGMAVYDGTAEGEVTRRDRHQMARVAGSSDSRARAQGSQQHQPISPSALHARGHAGSRYCVATGGEGEDEADKARAREGACERLVVLAKRRRHGLPPSQGDAKVCQQQCMHQRRASRVGGSLRRYVALEELAPRGKHHRDGEEQIDAAATWHIVTWDAMRWDEMG
jgi:hypothetical protein